MAGYQMPLFCVPERPIPRRAAIPLKIAAPGISDDFYFIPVCMDTDREQTEKSAPFPRFSLMAKVFDFSIVTNSKKSINNVGY